MSEKPAPSKAPEFGAPAPVAEKPAPTPLIPVRDLKFRNGMMVDLPGKNAVSGLRSSEPSAQAYWRIFYDPRLRHHRIEYYPPGAKSKPEVAFIPETWASWSPT